MRCSFILIIFLFSLLPSTVGHGDQKTSKVRTVQKRKHRGCSPNAPPRYRQMLRNWQIPPKIPKPNYREGFRDLTLHAVNHGERIRVFPFLGSGALDAAVQIEIQHLLRDKETEAEHAIHPRITKLLYKIAGHFNARQINVVSGYREEPDSPKEGPHKRGWAVDFMVPGTGLGNVARYARTLGHVGVGFYPVSGFVHIDVRDGPSYFWVDRSGPGKDACIHHVKEQLAQKYDRKWSAGQDEPEPSRDKLGELRDSVKNPPPEKELMPGKRRKSATR